MTRNQSMTFKIILFLMGVGVVVLAFILMNSGKGLADKDIFTWVSIALMYLLFFIPFFFSSLPIPGFSGKIPSFAMVWTGVFLYIVASVIVIALLNGIIISLRIAIIIQAVLFFLFAINVYFGYFASSHVHSVASEEHGRKQLLNEIKAKAQVLSLQVHGLPVEYEGAQKTLYNAFEDIKYLSSVDNHTGENLELKIIIALNKLAELCENVSEGGHPLLDAEAKNLQNCVKTRKLLRN